MKLSEYKKPPGQDWSEYIATTGCALLVMGVLTLAAVGVVMTLVAWVLGLFGYTIIHTGT